MDSKVNKKKRGRPPKKIDVNASPPLRWVIEDDIGYSREYSMANFSRDRFAEELGLSRAEVDEKFEEEILYE